MIIQIPLDKVKNKNRTNFTAATIGAQEYLRIASICWLTKLRFIHSEALFVINSAELAVKATIQPKPIFRNIRVCHGILFTIR